MTFGAALMASIAFALLLLVTLFSVLTVKDLREITRDLKATRNKLAEIEHRLLSIESLIETRCDHSSESTATRVVSSEMRSLLGLDLIPSHGVNANDFISINSTTKHKITFRRK